MNATAAELVGEGLTYRQLDHWSRVGYLRPTGAAGSGSRRRWSEVEQRVARLMARLVSAGLAVPIAAEIARGAVKAGEPTHYVTIGDGVYLSTVVDVEASA